MIFSYVVQKEGLTEDYNVYRMSKQACEFITTFPVEYLENYYGSPKYVDAILSLVDDEHFSPQYSFYSIFIHSNASIFYTLMSCFSDVNLEHTSFPYFFSTHPEILSTIYKHLDNYNMISIIPFFFKRLPGKSFDDCL